MFETRNLWSRVGFILFWCLRVSGILIVTFLFFLYLVFWIRVFMSMLFGSVRFDFVRKSLRFFRPQDCNFHQVIV